MSDMIVDDRITMWDVVRVSRIMTKEEELEFNKECEKFGDVDAYLRYMKKHNIVPENYC